MKDKLDAKERKKLGTKASAIRKKLKAGKEISAEDSKFLADWDGMKSKTKGAKVKTEAPPKQKPEVKTSELPTDVKFGEASETIKPEIPTTKIAPVTNRPPPPPTPRILGAGIAGKDWREKWRAGSSDREATCVQGAKLWRNFLYKCVDAIEEAEKKPMFSRDDVDKVIYPACVLTVDKFLPADFEMTPEVTVAFSSSALLGQRLFAGKKSPEETKEENVGKRYAGNDDEGKVIAIEEEREKMRREKEEAKNRVAELEAKEDEREVARVKPKDNHSDDEAMF